jgi:ankyrin repeat protein
VSPLALKKALNTLPPTLDDTYSRILQSIPDEQRDDAIRLLQLLVYSDKPLGLHEAVDAIAVDLTAKPYFDPRNRTPVPSEIILSCSGLVAIDRFEAPQTLYNGPREPLELQLAHFSVKQYLESERVGLDWKHCMSKYYAMASNTKVCLAYCFYLGTSLDAGDGEYSGDSDDLNCRPFAATAIEYWTRLAMHFEAQDHQLHEMIQDFLLSDELSGPRYEWLREREMLRDMLVPDQKWLRKEIDPKKLVPMTIASACGLHNSVKSLLLSGANPNEPCPIWGTALCAASYRGHYNIIKLLLKHGARPNMRTGRSELSLAISSRISTRRTEIFRTLLQHDADVNVCDESVGSPLVSAVRGEDEEIIDTLLAQGVEVNAVDYGGASAISQAAANGNDTLVRKLLEHKADVNISDGFALLEASSWGHKEVVRTLLENGAIVYQRPPQLSSPTTALQAACSKNKGETFELLIEHVNDRESLGECLVHACRCSRTEIVKLLLKQKADVNAVGQFGSPLIAASTYGDEQLVQLLIHHGADINQAEVILYDDFDSTIRRTPLLHTIKVHSEQGDKHWPGGKAARLQNLKTLIAAGADLNKSDDRGQTPLHYAAVSYNPVSPKLIDILIEAGAVLDNVDKCGQTPVIKAVIESQTLRRYGGGVVFKSNLETLLGAGAKTHIQDVDGKTALHHAAKYGELVICTMLIKAGVEINIQGRDGDTALHNAACEDHSEVCKLLVEAGAELDIQDAQGETALYRAAPYGEPAICSMLVAAGAKTNIRNVRGKTALFLAATYGELAVCKILIEAGAKTNIRKLNGDTALHCAVWKNRRKICTMLVEAGTEVDIQGHNGETALHVAAYDGQLDNCTTLINAGANTNIQATNGDTALHYAVRKNWLQICTLLVEAGANTNLQGANGETALHIAAAYARRLLICKTLLDTGAETDVQNLNGEPALHCVVWKNRRKICTLLIEAGANANIQDANGETVLHIAAALDGQLPICKMLVEAGANLIVWNNRGLTPLQVAAEGNNSEVVAFLRSHSQREELEMIPPTEQ